MADELTCQKCGTPSGTSLVCPACIPLLSDYERLKLDKTWHQVIVIAANCSCEYCGHSAPYESGELCGDHIETKGARPDLRWDVTNGKSTCLPCHNRRHAGSVSPNLSMKQNKEKLKPKVDKGLCKKCRLLLAVKDGLCFKCLK